MRIIKILSISFLLFSSINAQKDYKQDVFNQGMENMNEFIEFLSYPNDANYKEDIYKLIDFTENKFNSLDFKTTRLITETLPLLLAEKEIDRDLNTVWIYLHLDGQPIDISR